MAEMVIKNRLKFANTSQGKCKKKSSECATFKIPMENLVTIEMKEITRPQP